MPDEGQLRLSVALADSFYSAAACVHMRMCLRTCCSFIHVRMCVASISRKFLTHSRAHSVGAATAFGVQVKLIHKGKMAPKDLRQCAEAIRKNAVECMQAVLQVTRLY
jgi:hypothetical protein